MEPLWKEKLELEVEEAELASQQLLGQLPAPVKWFLVVAAVALLPGYFVTRAAAERYWTKRYEPAVLSAKPAFANPLPVEVGTVSVARAGTSYSAAVKIQNPNLELSVTSATYQIHFYSARGERLYTYTDKFFLLPNQTKFLVAPKVSTTEPVASAKLELPATLPWQKRLSVREVKLSTTQPKTYNQLDPVAFVLEGSVTNQSPYELGRVRIVMLLYSARGEVIAASERSEFSLQPSKQRAFKQLWPNVLSQDVARAEVFADTNTLEEQNLKTPARTQGGASDLSRPEGTDSWDY